MFDLNGDGISKEELRDAMITFGKAPTDEELDAIMLKADVDNSGTIDFKEFLTLMVDNMK